ncbi:MAG: DUF86 domain-containing protein [Bacteroidia bacterium]|nr:DUF86 domain-containing protein [Bacteroidia bacterium]
MIQDAVIKNFETIGEAAYKLPKSLKMKYPAIAWKQIEGLRHVLVHDYYKISLSTLWSTKEKDITVLQEHLRDLIQQEYGAS